MAELRLNARLRTPEEIGSAPSRRLRRSGMVPGTVYGHDREPASIAIEYKPLYRALTTDAGLNALITLDIEGGADELTMPRAVERHPIRDEVTHVDLLIVSRTEKISTEVPISLVGEPVGLQDGGLLDQTMYQLAISAFPGSVPDSFEADVSGLAIGDTLTVADLAVPEGVEVTADPEAAVATVLQQRGAEVEEEAEGVEGEEGEAAAAESEGGEAGEG